MSEETLFHEALAKATPDERAAFLDQACAGDAGLRAAVEARLAVKLGATVDAGSRDVEEGGGQVGPYKLLRQLGEGGMGKVWAAEQSEPVRRRVALKLIKPGMDTARVIRRFEAERQALALMDHPNIARVLDAGATDQGRPYFVMELVKGEPITQYCDAHRVPLRERLGLFVRVCAAIQHAHQKGVLHRDIKPGNVLVGLEDGKPAPKVIDFGVAKALYQQLTDQSVYTEVGTVVGTLEYMSPEQAQLTALDVDTRSDGYALGVLLYELLTGTTPHERGRLRGVSLIEAVRIIREEEPPPPSVRSGRKELRGELDWITMKALEKDRTRRYESPSALARDVERHLAGEAVEASPPSATYRLRKFLGRHRGPAVAAALVLLAVVAGAAASAWQAVRATKAEAEAQREAKAARENARMAREAVRQFFTRTSEETLLNQPHMQTLRRDMLRIARDYYRQFAIGDAADPELRLEMGQALYRLANIEHMFGHHGEAMELFGQAAGLFGKLVEEGAGKNAKLGLADSLRMRGSLERTSPGRRPAGIGSLQAAKRVCDELIAELPDDPDGLVCLASTHLALAEASYSDPAAYTREATAAAGIYERLLQRQPADLRYSSGLGWVYHRLGNMYLSANRREEAGKAYERSLKLSRQLTARSPNDPQHHSLHLANLNDLAILARLSFRHDEGDRQFAEVWRLTEKLARDFPQTFEFRNYLAGDHINRAVAAREAGRFAEAESHYRRALDGLAELLRAFPDSRGQLRSNLANAHHGYAHLLQRQGRWGDAIPAWEKALGWWEECLREKDAKIPPLVNAGWASHYQGHAYANAGQPDKARESFRAAVEYRRRDATARPADPWANLNLAASLACAGEADEAARLVALATGGTAAKPDLLYSAACVLAFCAGDRECPEALRLLRRARAAGHFATPAAVESLAASGDFAGQRARPEFQAFLAELRAALAQPERLPMPRVTPPG